MNDTSPDWRFRAWSRLAEDMPPLVEGGPSHRAGSYVIQSTLANDEKGRPFLFSSPSATAIALDIAIKAADRALSLKEEIQISDQDTPFGDGSSVTIDSTSVLFDYLGEYMTVLTFSFQALEAFANEAIADKLDGPYWLVRRKGGCCWYEPEELERVASTDEKLSTILPNLLNKTNPKGTRDWESFVNLKRDRDATIHVKSRDSNPRVLSAADLRRQPLYLRFYEREVHDWVRTSVHMIDRFVDEDNCPLWLSHVKDVLKMNTKNLRANQKKPATKSRSERKRSSL